MEGRVLSEREVVDTEAWLSRVEAIDTGEAKERISDLLYTIRYLYGRLEYCDKTIADLHTQLRGG